MLSKQEIRRSARTIIIDEEGKIAVLEVKNGDYYVIPGGGIEDDESLEDCAIREALEEAACGVELIIKLGESEFESPVFKETINHSVCFLAKKINDCKEPAFTGEEMRNRFKLLWLPIDAAILLFESIKSSIPFEIELNNRDLEFIKIAKEYGCKNNLYK